MSLKPVLLAGVAAALSLASAAVAQTPAPYAEPPATFTRSTSSFDYVKRDVMIPMRDGVKLHTVILVPKAAKHEGILLTRTPYSADALSGYAQSPHLGPILNGYDNAVETVIEGGYIRVLQDVRGKYGSEGEYVMNRPLAGTTWNPTKVDHATDTYDTIDWLVKNIPESNGNVAILGISYDGFLPLMALINPHPALKASIPMNPMVDGWMGDDWFHNGAFRQQNIPYIYEQDGTAKNEEKWWSGAKDDYDLYMQAGSAGELGRTHGLEQAGFWRKILAHPSYDAFWRDQAMDKILSSQPLKVPVMLVHSLWDQEDIYGAPAVYKAIKPKDAKGDMVKLVLGPWHHGQEIEEASSLGAVKFDADTALWFRRKVLSHYPAHYLKDEAPPLDLAPFTAFETGINEWRRLPAWPAGVDGSAPKPTPLYLQPGDRAGFTAASGPAKTADYVSDPKKPVPYRARPSQPTGYTPDLSWVRWLVDDQREASGRTDVLSFATDVRTVPIKIACESVVHLTASTSGTDSDWVVKLIDVYPPETAPDVKMGGYQLPVAMDIFRGRYRESFETAKPLAANTPLPYHFALPNADHVFLPGHRIMVQVQSSWFPLYDRNPQTFVPNIFFAKPSDYVAATQRVTVSGPTESFVELPVVAAPAEAFARR
ncbi:CocE/NonD family hydrolase [soil metagenome]